MVVVVFRARLKPGIEKEMEETDARMAELAAAMPGFVSYRQYVSADGEGLAVVEFESHETAAAWRTHPGLPFATWPKIIRSRLDSINREEDEDLHEISLEGLYF